MYVFILFCFLSLNEMRGDEIRRDVNNDDVQHKKKDIRGDKERDQRRHV